jgi:hypothetical protein
MIAPHRALEPSEDDESIDRLVDAIVRRTRALRLESPLALFLEMHRPLAGLAHSAALCSIPLLEALAGPGVARSLPRLLESAEHIEKLIALLAEDRQG